uniref:Uncharacterized protein n=1 Tax=Caenorhabditis japonica TaxID=281687 RepID=A0A8R1DM72_CAEJA
MQIPPKPDTPPRSAGSLFPPPRTAQSQMTSSVTTGSTVSSSSSLHTSDTQFGVVSLVSDAGEDIAGCELSPEEEHWLKMAHIFTKNETPFREPKMAKTVRKLKVWHPKRTITWSFLRRLYNGRQDMKEEPVAELSNLSIKED